MLHKVSFKTASRSSDYLVTYFVVLNKDHSSVHMSTCMYMLASYLNVINK